MNGSYARRRLHARRTARRGGTPWWLIGLLGLMALGALGAVAGLGTAFAIYQSYADEYVPIDDKLRQTHIGLTEIYDRGGAEDGVFLGALTNKDAQLLEPVTLDQISPWMIEATISTEDNGFWEHPGVSVTGLVRAAWDNYVMGEVAPGRSTITQQLVKNVYICPSVGDERSVCAGAERTLDRKLREIAFAMELEQDYPKEHILELYLNQISYADRYVGVQAAAQGYFHKDAKDLTLAEAALLAGVPAAPTAYHPRINCVLVEGSDSECVVDGLGRTLVGGDAKERQEQVLDLMVEHGRATREEAEAAKKEDLRVYAATNPIKAAAFIDDQVEPRLVRMCEAGILEMIPGAADCTASVHSAGYKVTTTLDWAETERAIQMIDEFVTRGLENGCDCHNAAVVTIEPSTGQVVVYAPNRDPDNLTDPLIQGDIDQLNEINQPGSSFKPAVYLTWFDVLNKTPMSVLWDTSPLTIEGTAITNPRTGDPKSEGLVSARAALGGSQNVGAFRAASEAGVDNVIAMAGRLGITTLAQGFDPTFYSHPDVTYGASIATGGANIRAIDMAYMNSVIANMGAMVGVPHYADEVPVEEMRSYAGKEGTEYEKAWAQKSAFEKGYIRLPGTRKLDPVVILEVRDINGEVLFRQGEPEREQVVDAGSVWLLHSIMSDCTARFIIWGCSSDNNSGGLDFFLDGVKIPGGVKTGTQQGFNSAADTLETWMNGYSRYAATAVWVGNTGNKEVVDGPPYYPSANTTIRLFRNWMGEYHRYLRDDRGLFTTPEGFESLQPPNVTRVEFRTPATDRGLKGGCDQTVATWVRNDVSYESQCEKAEVDTRNGLLAGPDTPAQYREEREFVKLPDLKPELALELVKEFAEKKPGEVFIPIKPTAVSTGQPAVDIASPTNGRTLSDDTDVVGSVGTPNLKDWVLEFGKGSNPSEWQEIGKGDKAQTNAILGRIPLEGLEEGVYTVRLTAHDLVVGDLFVTVVVNVRVSGTPGPGEDDGDQDPGGTPGPGSGTFQHPRGTDECTDGTCGTPPLLIICGPGGWFVDKDRDYPNTEGWPTYEVEFAWQGVLVCSN